MTTGFLSKNKETILYGLSLAVLLILVRWLELRLIIIHNYYEIYIAAIALIFTGLGIWLALKLTRKKVETIIVEKPVYVNHSNGFSLNEDAVNELGLSPREIEVLALMATGLSNQQIAEKMFVSLNTIKTHSSKLFEKMEVARRTQAVDKARKMGLVA
jgi:DNA-binding NarL/FixJ family response regulator